MTASYIDREATSLLHIMADDASAAVGALQLNDAAAAAVERVRGGEQTNVALAVDGRLMPTDVAATVGAAASELSSSVVAFVYGCVVLDEAKGGLDVNRVTGQEVKELGRKKLVLLTWIGADVPARDRGRVAEQRSALRASLPSMQVHVEHTANSQAEAEHSAIVERVKVASGAFYDSGAKGADQTTEATASQGGAQPTDVSSRPKPRGGRKLVKKSAAAAE
jgi:hypothetical protein